MSQPQTLELPTGEKVDPTDTDELLKIWKRCSAVAAKCRASVTLLASLVAKQTPDVDARTRRAEGSRLRGTVEVPADGYDNKQLIHLWNTTDPEVRTRVLKIKEVGIQKREFDKLVNSKLPPKLELLVKQIRAANTGPAGNPRITKVEEINAERAQDGLGSLPGQGAAPSAEVG